LSHTTHQSTSDFTTLVTEMVTDQAPRLYAVVLELGAQVDGQIVAWGMALDDHACMTTTDGRNQYVLTEAGNALRYVRSRPGTTPRLVWATPAAASHCKPGPS
jgi:hypothetical protein